MTEIANESSSLSVHPVADLFPMLADDELKDLAADIAERGLLQPIVLDTEGRILDGRNRHAACAIAGIEPSFTTYDGDDPDGYALAVNIARRHLTKGQQAMVAARASCFMKQTEAARALHMSHDRVHRAKTVLDHAPDLADAVIAGSVPLDKAYETARDRKRAAESTDSQLAALRQKAPDLADQVTEERLGLTEAMGALRAREAEEKRRRQVATTLLCDVVVTVGQLDGFDTGQRYDPDMASPGRKGHSRSHRQRHRRTKTAHTRASAMFTAASVPSNYVRPAIAEEGAKAVTDPSTGRFEHKALVDEIRKRLSAKDLLPHVRAVSFDLQCKHLATAFANSRTPRPSTEGGLFHPDRLLKLGNGVRVLDERR